MAAPVVSNVREENVPNPEDHSAGACASSKPTKNILADAADGWTKGGRDSIAVDGQGDGRGDAMLPLPFSSSSALSPGNLLNALRADKEILPDDDEIRREIGGKCSIETACVRNVEGIGSVGGSSRAKTPAQSDGLKHSGESVQEADNHADGLTTCGRCSEQTGWLSASKSCAPCQSQEIKLASSASILARWWRCQAGSSVTARSEDRSHVGGRSNANGLHGDATAADGLRPSNESGGSAHQDNDSGAKLIEQCPGCSKDFMQWVYKQRAALSKRHMQKCCPHLLTSPPLVKKAKHDAQKAMKGASSCVTQVQDDEGEPEEIEHRFADPFAAYRCCGRTFLRTRDLEKHWARWHKSGVVACHGGYADPSNLTRKTINQLGLGVKLVSRTMGAHDRRELCVHSGGAMQHEPQTAAGIPARGQLSALGGAQTSPVQGRGKGGNIFLPGHGASSSFTDADDYDSDDSINIVLR
jgi:hypothetical protein